ncbi:E3 ubiquitin-protein ligase TRIM71-like [Ostrea edulis]|uniref:E3 ubiquitin-protein ligase TRIM71-like n=1 Tax=Ostrea edulis TaxID=37623 RepID=UPI0024AF53E0|nr:E3 ubiquitin-protein ligase TRIM71-like [Ostrea edulis]
MASATTLIQAQELITCDLCVKAVQQFCNSCQVSLCEDCINKHVKNLKSLKHDIAPFTKRTVQPVFPQCTSHFHQRCEGHCQQCDVPVCMKCVMGPNHKGHDIVDMADSIVQKKETIKRETKEIEDIILQSKAYDEVAEKKINKSVSCTSDLDQQAKNERKQWHLQVDHIFDALESLIQSNRDEDIATLNSYQSKLRGQSFRMIQTVQENKDILKSNEVSKVNFYKSKLNEFRTIPDVPDLTSPSLKTNAVQGRELGLDLGEYKATLQWTKTKKMKDLTIRGLLEESKVIASIPTNVKNLRRLVCVGSDRAWINGTDNMIICVDMHGTVQDTVINPFSKLPNDITVNRQGDLIYSDGASRTVNIVRHGKTETLITTPRGWHPMGLCCTRSGDILVSMVTTNYGHHKIVRYQEDRVIQEIDKDEHGYPIYQGDYLVNVKENDNGDIVTSDQNSDTVVAVGKTGKVRFRYNDRPPGRKRPFSPRQIVTDSMGHIIVADPNNQCLHILDQNGRFLRCVNNPELKGQPNGLSVDTRGRLWVGSWASGEMTVIKYMK